MNFSEASKIRQALNIITNSSDTITPFEVVSIRDNSDKMSIIALLRNMKHLASELKKDCDDSDKCYQKNKLVMQVFIDQLSKVIYLQTSNEKRISLILIGIGFVAECIQNFDRVENNSIAVINADRLLSLCLDSRKGGFLLAEAIKSTSSVTEYVDEALINNLFFEGKISFYQDLNNSLIAAAIAGKDRFPIGIFYDVVSKRNLLDNIESQDVAGEFDLSLLNGDEKGPVTKNTFLMFSSLLYLKREGAITNDNPDYGYKLGKNGFELSGMITANARPKHNWS